MSIIQVSCIDQVLTPTSTPVIASGGIKEDFVAFRFCSQWDGFYKTAVFWQHEQQPYHVLLDENNSCLIPAEVLTEEGTIYFGVFGVNDDGVQRTSNVLRYTIEKGTITTNTQPSDPTPDVYTQLLAAIAALGDNTGKADKVSNATAGNLASLDANGNLQDSGRKPGAAGGVATLDSEGKVPSGQLPAMDYIPTSQKGAAGGVASLGSDGKVPSGQLPAMDYIPTSQKGAAGGVASLGSDGKVPNGQLGSYGNVPSVQFSGAFSNGKYNSHFMRWHRVGNIVFVSCNLSVQMSGDSDFAEIDFTGLPDMTFPGAAAFCFPAVGWSLSAALTPTSSVVGVHIKLKATSNFPQYYDTDVYGSFWYYTEA